jgi:hypothetical protein
MLNKKTRSCSSSIKPSSCLYFVFTASGSAVLRFGSALVPGLMCHVDTLAGCIEIGLGEAKSFSLMHVFSSPDETYGDFIHFVVKDRVLKNAAHYKPVLVGSH